MDDGDHLFQIYLTYKLNQVLNLGNGKIIRADSRSIGYGKHIRIDHGYGFVTLYAPAA